MGINRLNGKPEISYFERFVLQHENIGRFEAAMDNIFGGKLEVSCKYLLHILTCRVLIQSFFDMLAEIRMAQLRDNIVIILGGKDLM